MMVKRYFVHFTDMVKDVISIPASKVCDYKESVSHTDYQALEQQLEEANKSQYMPGRLKCVKCNFVLISTNIHVMDGSFSANNKSETCPNCDVPMWKVTYKDGYKDIVESNDNLHDKNKVLRDASEFYAATGNWCDSPGRLMEGVSEIEKDGGKRAQQALKLTVKEAIKDAD
jgi:hypothetical protein